MRYGSSEYEYAEPFASALVNDQRFVAWVLSQTKFREFAADSRLLSNEMKAKRGVGAESWWRSHYTEACRCQGCSGQETDLLAVFEIPAGIRFALHFEVKQPADRFPKNKDQAGNYAIRAKCWASSPPQRVLPHSDADTVLLCCRTKLPEYSAHLEKFGSVITFQAIAQSFPMGTKRTPALKCEAGERSLYGKA